MTAARTGVTAQRSWQVWGLAASVVVTDPSSLDAAEGLARGVLDAVDLACSRFRNDSELALRRADLVHGATVTPLLATLMESALAVARWTDGAVDPTLGNDLISLGYDRDFAALQPSPGQLAPSPGGFTVPTRHVAGWQRITLDGRFLTVPADITVDLGATAKAVAADMAAARIAVELGCGVLVNLGGDIATDGPAPETMPIPDSAGTGRTSGGSFGAGSAPVGGVRRWSVAGHPGHSDMAGHWQVLVQDTKTDPAQQVSLPAGHGLATSSTAKRRWRQSGQMRHHILDPRFGLPAEAVWRSASVAAPSALEANAFSTAAIVKGHAAMAWLREEGVSARLVDQRGRVVTTAGWPAVEFAGVDTHG